MMTLTEQFLNDFISCIPIMFGVYLIFNFTRELLFKE